MIKARSFPWGIQIVDTQIMWDKGVRVGMVNADLKNDKTPNPYLLNNIQKLQAQGMKVGIYVTVKFSGASFASQAVFLREQYSDLERRRILLYYAPSLWVVGNSPGASVINGKLNEFITELSKMGFTKYPYLLMSETVAGQITSPALLDCPLWIASWGTNNPDIKLWKSWKFWQTGRASLEGVSVPSEFDSGQVPFEERVYDQSDVVVPPDDEEEPPVVVPPASLDTSLETAIKNNTIQLVRIADKLEEIFK